MSEKNKSIDSNQNDENIKIYDNDDAYLFGDTSLNESNEGEENEKNENLNENNDNNIVSPAQLSNKIMKEEELYQESEKNKYETPQNNNKEIQKIKNNIDNEKENNEKDNNINNNDDNDNENENEINQIYEDNNYNSPLQEDPLNNEKYIINEITTDMENENDQEFEESNKISIKSKENKTKEEYNNSNELKSQKEKENENESNESEVPLITLNFLSICQCCKNQFNSTKNIPYLFKCGHFFCKQCIEEQFTDEEGIKCPNDGLVGKYISELKILNNFITDKPPSQRTKIYKKCCDYHKGQNLTHYIEDTKELICVYCAFERFKSNPGVEIKDINEKCKSMESKIDNIIDDNQHNVEIIQSSLRDIKKNKEIEDNKINDVFNGLLETIKIKKEELLSKIDKLFTDNARKLSQKLEIFSGKLEKSETIKNQILMFQNNQEEISFSQIIDIYESFIKEINDIDKITLQKYRFIYDDDLTLRGIINKFGALEITEKKCDFIGAVQHINNISENINNNIYNNNYYNQPFIKVNKDINNINPSNSYTIDNFYHYISNKEKSIINEYNSFSNKSKDNTRNIYNLNNQKTNMTFNINSTIQNHDKSNLNTSSNNNLPITDMNKSSGNMKINNINNNNNKRLINNNKNTKNKLTKKYITNKKNPILLDVTSSTYGNSFSKIENHKNCGIRVNTPKSLIKKFNYNLSLGNNYALNNKNYINTLNNQKINSTKINVVKNRNLKLKNNKSITTPNRIDLKADKNIKNK